MITTRRSLLASLGLALPLVTIANGAHATTHHSMARHGKQHGLLAHMQRHGKTHRLASARHLHAKQA